MACALLLGWCVLLRLPTALPSVIDQDESLYLVIADQWAHGHLPYVTVFDQKPVGIYVAFRLTLAMLGRSVVSVRLLTAIFVFISACLLYRLALAISFRPNAGVAVAVAYPALSLLFGGTAANTEHFFITANLTGAWLLLRAHGLPLNFTVRWIHIGLAGLLFGLALQFKYLAAFESALFVALFLWAPSRFHTATSSGSMPPSTRALSAASLVATIALPTAIVGVSYWIAGRGPEFLSANLLANLRHLQDPMGPMRAVDALLLWGHATGYVLILWGASWLLSRRAASRSQPGSSSEVVLVIWLLVTLLEASVTRKFYLHYYLPTLAPISLLLGSAVARLGIGRAHCRTAIACACLVVALPLADVVRYDYLSWVAEWRKHGADRPARVAARLRSLLHPGDALYVANGQPVLYFLTGAELPTRYVFPSFLTSPHFSKVAGVEYRTEFRKIIARRPRCVVIGPTDNVRVAEFRSIVADMYEHTEVVDGVEILCRGQGPGNTSVKTDDQGAQATTSKDREN